MNSEIVGKPTDAGLHLPATPRPDSGRGRRATPRSSTMFLFCVFLPSCFHFMWKHLGAHARGQLSGCLWWCCSRSAFWRIPEGKPSGFEDGNLFNQGQLLSIPMILLVSGAVARGKDPKNPSTATPPRDPGWEDGARLRYREATRLWCSTYTQAPRDQKNKRRGCSCLRPANDSAGLL
jgi:hypothetical protein